MTAGAPDICTVCFWPVEMWHTPAKRDGVVVHAICLGENDHGVGTFPRKQAARAEPRNGWEVAARSGDLHAI